MLFESLSFILYRVDDKQNASIMEQSKHRTIYLVCNYKIKINTVKSGILVIL
jgi:hypothetical protein